MTQHWVHGTRQILQEAPNRRICNVVKQSAIHVWCVIWLLSIKQWIKECQQQQTQRQRSGGSQPFVKRRTNNAVWSRCSKIKHSWLFFRSRKQKQIPLIQHKSTMVEGRKAKTQVTPSPQASLPKFRPHSIPCWKYGVRNEKRIGLE